MVTAVVCALAFYRVQESVWIGGNDHTANVSCTSAFRARGADLNPTLVLDDDDVTRL